VSSPPLTSTSGPLRAELFAKRYEILEVIGSGAMGVVHRAYDTELRRTVAIKRLIDEGTGSPTPRRTRLLREARAIAKINHPNVIAVYDVGEYDGTDFVVMELVEGGPLRQRIREGPAWTIDDALDWMVDVGAALARAHDAGLVHRDVKPSNLLLTREQRLKVADFGVVKEIEDDSGPATLLSARAPITRVGQIVGTPRYMAPEQLRAESVDGRCDQYAWGLVAYELLGEQHPYGPAVTDDTLQQVVDGLFLPRSLRIDTPALPLAIEVIVMRALRAERSERFASMHDVLAALAEARRGLTLETRVRARLDGADDQARRDESKVPVAQPPAKPAPPPDATAITATVDDPPEATATIPQRASGTAPMPPELRPRPSGAGPPAPSPLRSRAQPSPRAEAPRATAPAPAPPSSRAGRFPTSVVGIVAIGAGAIAIAVIVGAIAVFALAARRSSTRLARAREGAKVVCSSSCARVVLINSARSSEVDVDVDGTMVALHVRAWPAVDVRPIDVTPGSRSITVSDSATGALVKWLTVDVEQGGTVVYVVDRPPNVCFSIERAGAAPIPMPPSSSTWSPPTKIDDWLPPGATARGRASFVGGACP